MTDASTGEKVRPRLQLFVVGDEPHSRRALENLRKLTELVQTPCEVEVVDVLKDYRRALESNVLVAPLLLISTPSTRVTVAGDLTDLDKVIEIMTTLADP